MNAVEQVREFNRFYTRLIGLLDAGLYHSPYSLTEVRVLYELAHRERPTASELRAALGLDAGYLSRMLRRFARNGLVATAPVTGDGRRTLLSLTAKGRKAFAPLDRQARAQVKAMLRGKPATERERLVGAMKQIERVLGAGSQGSGVRGPIALRQHRPGDMGWVVERHGALYWHEYQWDERFEGLVAGICADFIANLDPERERCWIAELNGERVGCIFCVKKSKTVAKLRMLLVEPAARGHGLGRRLVKECMDFARTAGYTRMTLWTQDVLLAARHLYGEAGFAIVVRKPGVQFGHRMVSETWEVDL